MTEGPIDRVKQSPEGARQEWLSAMQSLAEQIQKQQQNSQQMIQELMNTYMQLLNAPGSYLTGQAKQQSSKPSSRRPSSGWSRPNSSNSPSSSRLRSSSSPSSR